MAADEPVDHETRVSTAVRLACNSIGISLHEKVLANVYGSTVSLCQMALVHRWLTVLALWQDR